MEVVRVTLTSRQFNQDLGGAKRAAVAGPVLITDRGKPTHVLLTFEEYENLKGDTPSIGTLLGMPGAEDLDLESVLPSRSDLGRPIDLS